MFALVSFAAFYMVVMRLCQDRPSCTVLASPETFTQDPCLGTPKYLEVHYKCRPEEFSHVTVCEGEDMKIACQGVTRVAVYSAMFGRTPNGTERCAANKQGYIDCQANESLAEVRALCHGKKNCVVRASHSLFGDPCPSGINKYLSVSYVCVPRKILKQYNHKKGKRKKKKKGNNKHLADDIVNVTIISTTARTVTTTTTTTISTTIVDTTENLFPAPSGDQLLQPSLETSDQDIVTEAFPLPESQSEDLTESYSLNEFTSEGPAITTEKDQPVTTEQDEQSAHTSAPDTSDESHQNLPKYIHRTERIEENEGTASVHDRKTGEVTEPEEVTTQSRKIVEEVIYEDRLSVLENSDERADNFHNVSDITNSDTESASEKTPNNEIPYGINNNFDSTGSKETINEAENWFPGIVSTSSPQALTTSLNPELDNNFGNQESESDSDSSQTPVPNMVQKVPESPFVTERNLTVLCINYTRPDVRWIGLVRPNNEYAIGFLRDWFSVIHFIQVNQEKAWLYFVLGISFGIIVMLIVILVKVCFNFHRNIRARLDVSEPTHRSAHTNNHSTLDAPMLEHSDSVDRIEVVRFSPRNTLRSQRSNSHHRDLVNYYG